jgi:hypothetical protein
MRFCSPSTQDTADRTREMSDIGKRGKTNGHGGFEHQDLSPSALIYFFLSLAVFIVVSIFILKGFFAYLDYREKAMEQPVSPLVKHVPEDTRHVAPGYPQTAFPNPRLETDERSQLGGFLLDQDQILYSYGWVDEKAGIVRIPIERAMDLLVQRGLPVLSQGATNEAPAMTAQNNQRANAARGAKGAKGTQK